MALNDLITFRKGTATEWNTANPVLASGEPGYDLTNSVLKIGNGISDWTSLSGHSHTSSNITNFNSSVSGLLPVTNITAGTGIGISSSSGNFTVTNSSSIINYSTSNSFPATGVSGYYYLDSDSGRLYQWTGSYYAEIGPPISSVNNAQNAANLYMWSNFK